VPSVDAVASRECATIAHTHIHESQVLDVFLPSSLMHVLYTSARAHLKQQRSVLQPSAEQHASNIYAVLWLHGRHLFGYVHAVRQHWLLLVLVVHTKDLR
jgi:hypothetical protein